MRAVSADGQAGSWSAPKEFQQEGPEMPAVSLNGQTGELAWEPLDGAGGYELLVYDLSTGREVLRYSDVEGTTFAVPDDWQSPGGYQVFVRGINPDGGEGIWCSPMEAVFGDPA